MKVLSLTDIRKLDEKKLVSSLNDVAKALLEATMQLHQNQLKDISSLQKYKKFRARLLTVRNERAVERVVGELAASASPSESSD
jgi:ribosomal protein L29